MNNNRVSQLKRRKTFRDASTMTMNDVVYSFECQYRLKALEFIRLYLENTHEDFCRYLIENEHLSLTKISHISQIIQQFLFISNQSLTNSC